jgi:hypothetical protein
VFVRSHSKPYTRRHADQVQLNILCCTWPSYWVLWGKIGYATSYHYVLRESSTSGYNPEVFGQNTATPKWQVYRTPSFKAALLASFLQLSCVDYCPRSNFMRCSYQELTKKEEKLGFSQYSHLSQNDQFWCYHVLSEQHAGYSSFS